MSEKIINKLPAITLSFWIMKICATTLGETGGDLFSQTLNFGYTITSICLIGIFFLALFLQLSSKKFYPALYWTVILATSTAGTTISDFMDRTLGLGYAKGSLIIVSTLIIILSIWYLKEKTLSVTNIKTRSAEIFYWFAILASNTLGTAFGDFLSDNSGLGFLGGALVIGSTIAVLAILYKYTKVNRILIFWFAFILTRPLGATVGDLFTKSVPKGGLGFGTIGSSLILLTILIILIIRSVKTEKRNTLRLD